MANPGYLRSTDGNDADDGSTWNLANALASAAMSDHVAGDRIWMSQVHSESSATAQTIAFPGTIASPNQFLCGNDSSEPPTALATTGIIATTGASNISMSGSVYGYGVVFNCGTGSASASIQINTTAGHKQVWESCDFVLQTTNANSQVALGTNSNFAASETDLINCRFKAANVSATIRPSTKTRMRGGSWISGGTSPTNIFNFTATRTADVLIDAFDFTNLGSGFNVILGGTISNTGKIVLRNCKMPAGWSGGLVSTDITTPGFRAEMYNTDAGETNYKIWIEDYCGSIKDETTIVKTSGASDGATPISWKMTSTANAEFPTHLLRSPEIAIWNGIAGTPRTITLDIATTGGPLNDDDIYIDVQVPGTPGSPTSKLPSTFVFDRKTDVVTAAQIQTISTAVWPNLGSPGTTQKLVVTVTPGALGYLIITVVLAKPSTTVYVDQFPTLS